MSYQCALQNLETQLVALMYIDRLNEKQTTIFDVSLFNSSILIVSKVSLMFTYNFFPPGPYNGFI